MMRVAFYAPLKPPDHPVPSGDRRMAQLLMAALTARGHEVELVSRLRSLDRNGNPQRQMRIAAVGARLAQRLVRRLQKRPPDRRPRLWLTYHLYYKAPDWLGPRVAGALGIPYVVVEASLAPKRAGGLWSTGHAAVEAALARAAAVASFHEIDEAGIAPAVAHRARLHRLKPFLDAGPFQAAARVRDSARARLAQAHGLDLDIPWLLAVAMMRPGDKLASYLRLAEALTPLAATPWHLLCVGDGAARSAIEAAFAPLGDRVRMLGARDAAEMPAILAAGDLMVWPAINEAWGMALLEAQASALPVVAGDSGGVAEIVRDGRTGWLVPPGDVARFTGALAQALADPDLRRARGAAAWKKVAAEHDLPAAGESLDRILDAALRGVP
jgi:glycosyltransferase involved in cell wall biosynthesis